MSEADIQQVRAMVRGASRIFVMTGAGMSAESGVPTFRDAQTGLWAKFDPQQLATEQAFRAAPGMVWDWYAMRRDMIASVKPNAGHIALAAFARRHPGRLTLVTQNVDGLHQRAGSADVLALHGNIAHDKWLDPAKPCCDLDATRAGRPPACPHCGNMLRPDVVWFGEMLPTRTLLRAQQAARECDLMIVVGTSGVVYPAAGLAHESGGPLVVVNPDETGLDDGAQLVLRGTAARVLPRLLEN
jgi:NAD-dependent deacetylase